jgi:hypothetical protein
LRALEALFTARPVGLAIQHVCRRAHNHAAQSERCWQTIAVMTSAAVNAVYAGHVRDHTCLPCGVHAPMLALLCIYIRSIQSCMHTFVHCPTLQDSRCCYTATVAALLWL